MKRFISIILLLITCQSLCACGSSGSAEVATKTIDDFENVKAEIAPLIQERLDGYSPYLEKHNLSEIKFSIDDIVYSNVSKQYTGYISYYFKSLNGNYSQEDFEEIKPLINTIGYSVVSDKRKKTVLLTSDNRSVWVYHDDKTKTGKKDLYYYHYNIYVDGELFISVEDNKIDAMEEQARKEAEWAEYMKEYKENIKSYSSSNSSIKLCKSCGREFSDATNKNYIIHTNMCRNCYRNFCWAMDMTPKDYDKD